MKKTSLLNINGWPTRTLWVLSLLCGFFSSVHAGTNSGADFLKIPIGAEPAGLGQAYTAAAHGINALNWNPAGIVRTPSYTERPSIGLSLSHQDQFSESNLDHLGVTIPHASGRSSWGFDLLRLSHAEQEGRDSERRQTGSIEASDMAIGAAFAQNFGPAQAGIQLKFIRQELSSQKSDGFAVDLGLLSASPLPRLSLGAAVRNLGPQMKFLQESYQLPLSLSVGGLYHVTGSMMLAADVHYKPHQRQTVMSLGTQISATQNLTLRAGYLSKLAEAVQNSQKSETNRGDFGNVTGIAGGIGLQFSQFNLDYSITPFGELGNTQMLTLSTWFGKDSAKDTMLKLPFEVEETIKPIDNRIIMIISIPAETWWGSLRP